MELVLDGQPFGAAAVREEFMRCREWLAGQLAPKQPEVLRVNYSGQVGEGDTTLISRAI